MKNKKEIFLGFVLGLIATCIGLVITVFIFSDNESIKQSIVNSYYQGFLTKLISLGSVVNVILFFVLIKKNKDIIAKGVLMATIVAAIITLILK